MHVIPELGEVEVINVEDTIGSMSYQSIVRIDDLWHAITAGVQLGKLKYLNSFDNRFQSELDASSQGQQFSNKGLISSQAWLYSLQLRQLKPLSSLSFPRFYHSSVVFRNQLIVTAGKTYGCEGDAKGVLSSCERLETLKGKWTSMGDLVKPRFGHSSLVFNDKLFVFGGITTSSTSNDDGIISIEEWDEKQQLWKEYAIVNEKQKYCENNRIVSDCKLLSELFQTANEGGGNLIIFQNDMQDIEVDSNGMRFTELNLEDKQVRNLGMVEVVRDQEGQYELSIEDRRNHDLNQQSDQLPMKDKRYIFTKSLLNEDHIDVYSMQLSQPNNRTSITRFCKLEMTIAYDNLYRYASERNLTNSMLPIEESLFINDNQRKTNQPDIFLRLKDNRHLQIIEIQKTTDLVINQQIMFQVEFPEQRKFLFISRVVEMNKGQIFVVLTTQIKDKGFNENACFIYSSLENHLESLPRLPVCLPENQYVVYFCEELRLMYLLINHPHEQYCFWYDVIFAKWRRIYLESIERGQEEINCNQLNYINPLEMSVSLKDYNGFIVSLEISHKERVMAVNIIDLKHATIEIHTTMKPTDSSLIQVKNKELFSLSSTFLTQNQNTNNNNSLSSLYPDKIFTYPHSSSLADLSAIEYVIFIKQSISDYYILRFIPLTFKFSIVKCQPQKNLPMLFFNDCACVEIQNFGILLTGGNHNGAAVKYCRIWTRENQNNSNPHALNTFDKVSDMLDRRIQHSLLCFRNRFYAIGGAESFISKSALKTVESFDLTSGFWRQEPNMVLGRKQFGCCVIRDDYILVAGGITESQQHCYPCLTDSIEVFDGKEWKKLRTKLNSPLEGLRAVMLPSSREIVFVGGKKDRMKREITLIEDFTIEKEDILKQKSIDKDERVDYKTEVIDELQTFSSSCHVVHVGYDMFVLGGNTLNQVEQFNLVIPGTQRKKCIIDELTKYQSY